MSITKKTWIRYIDTDTPKIELKDPIAIVGSPGLRSVGKIVVDELVKELEPELFAELYSYGFPGIYYGPSYLGAPCSAGAQIVGNNVAELPVVRVYILYKSQEQAQTQIQTQTQTQTQTHGRDIVMVTGYQAYDALNQYIVAEKLTDLFTELQITEVISLGAQVVEKGVRCCATDVELVAAMSKYGIEKTHVDRFIGLTGLVTAIAGKKSIKGVCLFASTEQNLTEPEYPDFTAAKELLEKVEAVVGLKVDAFGLEENRRRENEQIEENTKRAEEERIYQEKERERERDGDTPIGYA